MLSARPILIVLLSVLLLPWGAYAMRFPAGAAPDAVTVGESAATMVLPAPRRCRSGVLPGSQCDVRFMGAADPAPQVVAVSRLAWPVASAWPAEGEGPAPLLGPPRPS